MKAIFLITLFFLRYFIFPQPLEDNTFRDLQIQLETLVPREEGSINEEKTIILLDQFAKKIKVKTKISTLNPITVNAFSYSKNVEFFIPGSTQNEILYLIPLNQTNTIFFPILLLIKELKERQHSFNTSARFVFLGAEYGKEPAYPMGSKSLLYTYNPSPKTLFFYLDITHPSRNIQLFSLSTKLPNLWLLQQTKNILKNASLKPVYPHFASGIDALYKPYKKTSTLDLYKAEHLQGIYLSSNQDKSKNNPNEVNINEWSRNLATAFRDWHLSLDQKNFQLPELTSSQYGIGATLFITEKNYVLALLILYIVTLFFVYTRLRSIPNFLRNVRKRLKDTTLFIFLVFTANVLAGLCMLSFLILIGNIELWKQQPLLTFVYKITVMFMITLLLLKIFMPKFFLYNSDTDFHTAIIISIITFFVFFLIKIFASLPVLWMILCLATASYMIAKIPRILFICLSPIWIVLNFYSIFASKSNTSMQHFFLFNDPVANIFLTLLIIPIFYAFKSLNKKSAKNPLLKRTGLAILIVWILSIPSFSFVMIKLLKNYQPLQISILENLNLAFTTIFLESPKQIGSFRLLWNQKIFPITNASKKAIIETEPKNNNLHITAHVKNLGKKNMLEIKITPSQHINFYDIKITNNTDFFIISSNYPWISENQNARGKRHFSILTGKNPKNPLTIVVICNKAQGTLIKVVATIFNDPNIQAFDKNFEIQTTTKISKEIVVA